jgi:uncharacterized SAM-binding protein YcdF (DUF218 family)
MRCALGLRLLGIVGVSVFMVSAFTPMPNLLAGRNGQPPRLEPADAIVVLGAGIHPDGALTNGSLRRTLRGVILQREGFGRLLVLLGPARDGGPAEAGVRAELARELGIPAGAILTEEEARTTRQEASRVNGLLQPRGVRRILLVTDSQHMPRARRLFERAGFEVFPSEADDVSRAAVDPEERLRLMRRIVQEYVARLYYRLAGYLPG